MKTKTDSDNALVKQVKQWKKDQAIISLTLDEMIKAANGHQVISEQKVDGQTGLMGYDKGDDPKFATLGGVLYWDLPVLEEIKKILNSKKINHARIVGEMAGYANGKIIPFNETESIIKNPKADKTKVHWFVYHIIELNNDKYSTTDFEQYEKTWSELKKLFKGSKYIHPVKDYSGGPEAIKKSWTKLVLKDKNEGIVIRTDDNKVYKCKPTFTYDLAIIAIGDKQGKNWSKGKIGMTLMAFMDNDHIFRTAGNVGTGWDDKESKKLFSWAQKNKVGEDKTYIWVKPKKIMEVQWERTTIKEMPAYKYSKGKYELVGKKIVGTIVKPRFIRWRTDKSATPGDLRLTQIPDWNKQKKMASIIAHRYLISNETGWTPNVKSQFDPNLKGAHYKNLATHEILEATGNYAIRAGMRSIQVIHKYTNQGQPLGTFLLEDSLQKTNEALSPLQNKPEKKMAMRIVFNFLQASQDPDEKLKYDKFYYDTFGDEEDKKGNYARS